MNFHEKSGHCSSRNERVMLNLVFGAKLFQSVPFHACDQPTYRVACFAPAKNKYITLFLDPFPGSVTHFTFFLLIRSINVCVLFTRPNNFLASLLVFFIFHTVVLQTNLLDRYRHTFGHAEGLRNVTLVLV